MTDSKKPDAGKTAEGTAPETGGQVLFGNQSIHDTVQRQVAEILENADLTDEEREQILIAMSCPCCGAGGLSFTVPLKPRSGSTPKF